MPEDFITKVELTEALATHGIDGATKDVTTSAEVDAKIKAALDAQKAPEPAKPAEPPRRRKPSPQEEGRRGADKRLEVVGSHRTQPGQE